MMIDFLSLHEPAFGLDISDLSFKIAKLHPHGSSFSIQALRSFVLPEGIIEHGEIKKEDELGYALAKAVASLRGTLKARNVVASLPEEQAFLQVIQLPKMAREEVEHALRFEAENYIPYPLESVYLDFQEIHPFKNHLDHEDVLLAALSKATVDGYVSVFEKIGLRPIALEIESLAIARAIVPHETSATPVLVVDFGATRTSFLVFSGYSLRLTASIPISSRQLTLAVASALNVAEEEAKTIKHELGLGREGVRGKKVADAIEPLLLNMADQIKKHIEFFESHTTHQHLVSPSTLIARVILSGGGARIKGLPAFLSQSLERQVVLGNPWVNIIASGAKELPKISFEESLHYTAALGLALRAASHP